MTACSVDYSDASLQQKLRERLIRLIRAIAEPLSGVLEPALNGVGHGVVTTETRLAGWAYFGAPLWAAHAAMMDCANRVLGMPLDRSFIDTVEHCGLYWTLDGICIAAARPSQINRDEVGHLHCEVGPAIAYPSGWASWDWHGIKVPQIVVETPERITSEAIGAERVPALRRGMIERSCLASRSRR